MPLEHRNGLILFYRYKPGGKPRFTGNVFHRLRLSWGIEAGLICRYGKIDRQALHAWEAWPVMKAVPKLWAEYLIEPAHFGLGQAMAAQCIRQLELTLPADPKLRARLAKMVAEFPPA